MRSYSIRIYKYGVYYAADRAVLARLGELLHLATEFQRTLVQIANEARCELRELREQRFPQLRAARESLDAAQQGLRELVAMAADRSTETYKQSKRQAAAARREAQRIYYEQLRVVRKDEATRELAQAIYQREADRSRTAYRESPLHWGPKDDIRMRLQAAKRKTPDDEMLRLPRRSRDGRYHYAVKREPTGLALSGESRWFCLRRDTRYQSRRRWIAQVRVGSIGREPLWLELPIAYSRPLPEGAVILGVSVVRRQVARQIQSDGTLRDHDEWSVQVTLEIPRHEEPLPPTDACIGIDLGWRRVDGRLRVAVGHTSDGEVRELYLPDHWLRTVEVIEEAQSERDRARNAVREALVGYLAERGDAVPGEIRAQVENLAYWLSYERFRRLFDAWVRHPGDEEIYLVLRSWRYSDVRAEQTVRYHTVRLMRQRLDLYRVWARRIADSYRWIGVEDMNIAAMRREGDGCNGAREEGEDNRSVNIRWRNLASIGLLRSCIAAAAEYRCVQVPTEATTSRCVACGAEDGIPEDARAQVIVRCQHCGRTSDQDVNAAKNIVARIPAAVEELEQKRRERESSNETRGYWQRKRKVRSQGGEEPEPVQ